MSSHHTITFSTNQPQGENAKYFASVALMTVFVQAIKQTDARTQRNEISEGLRMATIRGIDGLDILRQALNDKYEANQKILAVPLKFTELDGFRCPKCNKPHKSANALNAHRPLKCNAAWQQ